MRILKVVSVFSILFTLILPAAAQDITRLKMSNLGEDFIVELKSNSVYAVDPFPYDFGSTPEAMIVDGLCASSLNSSSAKRLMSHTYFETFSSRCVLKLRALVQGRKTHVFTLIRARKAIQIDLSENWQKVKLGRGTYTLVPNFDAVAEIAIAESSKGDGCRTAHNGVKNPKRKGIASFSEMEDGEEISIIAGSTTWYRILSKPCTMKMRAHDGQTGTLTLLKLSSKAINPPKF